MYTYPKSSVKWSVSLLNALPTRLEYIINFLISPSVALDVVLFMHQNCCTREMSRCQAQSHEAVCSSQSSTSLSHAQASNSTCLKDKLFLLHNQVIFRLAIVASSFSEPTKLLSLDWALHLMNATFSQRLHFLLCWMRQCEQHFHIQLCIKCFDGLSLQGVYN